MSLPPHPLAARHRPGGFTLIELLVVIVIVAILAGILFSVFGQVQNKARKVQVVADMRNAKTSILAFYTEYHKYPLNNVQADASSTDYGNGTYDTVYGDPGAGSLYRSADLFNILRAVADAHYNQNNQLNPSKTVYWSGQLAKNPASPREGITPADYNNGSYIVPKGSFVDPWGNEYIIWFDANKDNDMSVAVHWFYNDSSDTIGTMKVPDFPMGILWASLGPDGKWGTKGDGNLKNSDDIVSWQQ